MIAMMNSHERWSRTSNPRIRAIGDAVHATGPSVGSGAATRRRRPARSPGRGRASCRATSHTTAASRRMNPPSAIVVSDQKSNGKSWTSWSVARVEGVRAAREEQLVEDLERLVEEERRDHAGDDDRRPPGTASRSAMARQARAGVARPRGHDEQHDERRRRRRSRGRRTRRRRRGRRACAPARAPRGPAAPFDLDVEVRRPEDEVVEDRVRRGRELVGRVAGPARPPRPGPARTTPTAGVRNGRIAMAITTMAAARPIRTEATFSPTVPVTRAC